MSIDEKWTYTLNINGFKVEAQYYADDVERIFVPILKKITEIHEKNARRTFVFLASSPGMGKTTLATFFAMLSEQREDIHPIQSIGLDGFHRKRDYLLSHTMEIEGRSVIMNDVKGCPETFDIEKAAEKLHQLQTHKAVKWPLYDRVLHDVVEDQITVNGDIVLIEGNWLLLDEDHWRELVKFCDYRIFVRGSETLLEERLVKRKMMGGLSFEEARQFYFSSDRKNVLRAQAKVLPADCVLELQDNGHYTCGGKHE